MPRKNPPIHSIETAGGLQAYVLKFYERREQPDHQHTWDEVLHFFHFKQQNWTKAAFELDISVNTYKKWYAKYTEQ